MAGAPGQKKQDPLMIVIMLCVAVIAVYFAAALGTAMDLAKDHESGEIKFSELAVEATMSDYDLVFEHLQDKESYAPKLAMFAGIKALLSALAFYLCEVGEPEDRNWANVMQLLKYADVKEGKDDFKSPLDIKFDELEEKNPISMAVTYYKDFKKAAGETAKSILISCAVNNVGDICSTLTSKEQP